ncbi:S-adenosylmethionine mitochondrial carrier protein isoform X2 [Bubalus bubalis]|uniref:S-adenosylmethionine mitochondrial carrier protein isoform X2 n=1 Tax=Bubalus bubalis TaxID=89462 RepID=UPI001D10BA77|nr:S-adenosylmethionine mitochondrial carrier protein isoform X2 [Bubalus bubalis]
MDRPGFTASLVAGGVAGVFVDLILFPLDTIKTRLQSPQGFYKAGGFYGVYAGVPSTAIGSFPNAAAFFVTYEYVKWILHTDSSSYLMPVTHMLAASAGEVVACLIRVPSEVVKQRAQVSASSGTFHIFSNILCQEGIQGLYRGYKSTVLREIPFSLVQFPLWESLKALWSWRQDHVVDSWQSAVCGAFADYLQVSSLAWQPSVWEVSSFLVFTTKLAAFCWNLAERAPESEMAPAFKKGSCCEKSFPSSEQLSSHLNSETQCRVQSRSGYNMEDTSSVLQAGWGDVIGSFARVEREMMSTVKQQIHIFCGSNNQLTVENRILDVLTFWNSGDT